MDEFDALVQAYEQLGEALPLVLAYRELFIGEPRMAEALALLYEDILEFHRRALRIFQSRAWRRMFRSMWKDFDARFKNILEGIRRHKELLESHATLSQFHKYHIDRQLEAERWKQLENDKADTRYLGIQEWLRPVDALADHVNVTQHWKEFPRSGEWIFNYVKYSTWRTDDVPRSSILWLHGIPGAGKSVLASRIVQHCQEDKGARTVFFYCKHGDPERNTAIAVLRTLLSQVLTRAHVLLPWCYDEFIRSGLPSLSSNRLCLDLLEATLLDGQTTFIVVDGIDECVQGERIVLLSVLQELVDACELKEPGFVRLLVVSQDEPDIRRSLRSNAEIALGMSDNLVDISAFVRHWCQKLQQKFGIDEQEMDYI